MKKSRDKSYFLAMHPASQLAAKILEYRPTMRRLGKDVEVVVL
jgi:hypothetical protein